MSQRVYFEGEPLAQYTEFVPRFKFPRFALFNAGRHPNPHYAMAEAIARRNQCRLGRTGWREHTDGAEIYSATFTNRRQALPGSDLFHVPRATILFRVKVQSGPEIQDSV